MKSKLALVLGMIWASPITAVCFLFYILPFWALGWYRYIGFRDVAWLWKVQETAPDWLHRLWKGWAGHCVGNAIVMIEDPDISKRFQVVLTHEQEHVYQCMKLGVFQPIFYYLIRLVIWVSCSHAHPYYDNPFEIDARRAAGQVIDYKK